MNTQESTAFLYSNDEPSQLNEIRREEITTENANSVYHRLGESNPKIKMEPEEIQNSKIVSGHKIK